MGKSYLGVDVGSSKTHALITDGAGKALGFGEGGAGNHEVVGYPGLMRAVVDAVGQALRTAGITIADLGGAGFGVSGYDWPSEKEPTLEAISVLGIEAPVEVVNDTILGLLAGSAEGWGIALVSGTGCNCRGWDRLHTREGRVTGNGMWMGEGAGASEVMQRAIRAVAYEWTQRSPATRLTPAFMAYTKTTSAAALLEGLATDQVHIGPEAARLVFEVAASGDPVAVDILRWAGRELGELAGCVIRQLEFERMDFDVVMIGSMFEGGALLIEPLREAIAGYAPGAHLVRMVAPPVIGAVLLGMEAGGIKPAPQVREALLRSGDLSCSDND